MLRLNLLAVVCLGLLVSCGPSESASAALGGSGGRQSTALLAQSAAQISPSLVDFGEQPVGVPGAARVVTVLNTGSAPLQVSASLSGSQASLFSVTLGTFTLAPNASAPLSVVFSPTTVGVASATLVFTTNEAGSPTVTVALSGVGVSPSIAVDPTVLDFGEQSVGGNAVRTVTVVNSGTGTLAISNATLSGSGAAAYSVTPTSFSVPAGGSRQLTVAFSPTVPGAATATLTLSTNDVNRPTVTVAITGTGASPSASVSPSLLAFGEQGVNTTVTRTVTVTNTGTGNLLVNSIALGGSGATAFTVLPSSGFSLQGGQSRDLLVSFRPTAVGAVTATLTLSTNDPARATLVVPITGAGVSPTISVGPAVLDFGTVPVNGNKTLTLTVSNIGTGTLTANLTKSGSGAAAFTFSPASIDVPAGQSRSVTVVFSPVVQGLAQAQLALSSNDVSNPTVTIALSGSGGGATAVMSPSVLDFGGVRVGATRQLTATLTNAGTAPLIVTAAPTATGPFTYAGPASFTVQPNSSISFQVAFAPTSQGSFTGTLTFTSNASNGPTVLSVTGVGTTAQASVSPGTVFFGDVRVGSESQRRAITLTNTGSGELVLQSLPVQGPFTVALRSSDALPIVVAPNSSFVFDVIFKPTAPGAATGSVSLMTDLPSPLMVSLSGTGTLAKLSWSVISLDFGQQRLTQTSAEQVVVVSNPGTAELEITQLLVSQPDFKLNAPLPPPSQEQPLRIAPGQQKLLALVFTPSTLGETTGKLFAVSNAFEPAPPVELKGVGVDGQLSLAPANVIFGAVEVGSSVQQAVTVKNTGSYPVKITQVTPPADAAFTLSGLPTGLVLAPAESWTFTVTFAPTRRGAFPSSAVIESDAFTNRLFNLMMSGTGVGAAAELQPSELDFGSSNVGQAVMRELVIKNVGERELVVSSITFADAAAGPVGGALDFSLGGGVLPLLVAPSQSALVRVQFLPRAAGPRAARAVLATNAGSLEANLRGVGTASSLQLSATQLDFGNVLVGHSVAPRILTLTNVGTGVLVVSGLSVGGTDAAAFSVATPQLPVALPAGASVDVAVSFLPNAERAFSGLLQVISSAPATPTVAVPLSGTGIGQSIHLSESSLDFGRQLVGSTSSPRKVRIVNAGGSPATVSALFVEGSAASHFALTSPALPFVVAPGQEAELSVAFTPQAEVDVNGTLKVVLANPSLQLTVALHGEGIRAALTVSPSALDFGLVEVGTPCGFKEITVTNTSSQEQRVTARLKEEVAAFSVDSSELATPIPAGGSRVIRVSFQPQGEGEVRNEVQVFAQGATAPAGVVPVKGTGTQAEEPPGCSSSGSGAGGSVTLALLALAALGARRWRWARG
ncbi:choice-of-anchor D domain-containing protein [Hyalangium gracile]|uniref:choice-of-anchor D domain-containing protein n=1 Tax=Hyalangium gracile TaxID=394092 RepID=UPI001CCF4430|nr:choice-of-anchor D domain-containing protein [Hyalangium gracile]